MSAPSTPRADRLVRPAGDVVLSSTERLRLACEILTIYPRAWWLLRRHGLDRALEEMRRPLAAEQPGGGEISVASAIRLGWFVVRFLRLLPTDTRCLMRSLVLTWLLARRGVASRLVIAVRTRPDFAAHAWVELEGEPVLIPSRPPFERLLDR